MNWRLGIMLVWAVAQHLSAQEGDSPTDKHGASKTPGLSAEEKARLEKEKVLVSRHEVKQCFTAYMDGRYPRFVTSDAVLNAYHVLFEETLREQEEYQARQVRTLCTSLWKLLATADRMYVGDAAKIAASKKRARFILGVATGLLGDSLGECESDLKRAIEIEVKAVQKAEGMRKPPLLGKPEPGFLALDYSLFRPVGFYDTSVPLRRYFRALRWLQVVPFRVDHEEELLAYHMLEMVLQSPRKWGGGIKNAKHLPIGLDMNTHEGLTRALSKRRVFVSDYGLAQGDFDLIELVISPGDEAPVTVDPAFFEKRALIVRDGQTTVRILGNDRVRTTEPDGTEREFRVLSAFRLPEDDALSLLSRESGRAQSPAVEFAAWLGVPQAEAMLGKSRVALLTPTRPKVEIYHDEKLKQLPWWQTVLNGYGEMSLNYRAALRLLVEVDARAPDFMRSDAWRTKTLQTVTSSWAQERHAWSLQSKPQMHVLSAAPMEKGFVEPVPDFFRLLGRTAASIGNLAFEVEVNTDPVTPAVEQLRAESRQMKEAITNNSSQADISTSVWVGNRTLGSYCGFGSGIDDESAKVADVHRIANMLATLADDMEREARPGTPYWERIQAKRIHTTRLWHRLEILCMRLGALAEKQLQKVPLSAEDGSLIEGIGYELSEIMLYRGQAMIFPRDDAPRITRISSDPQTGEILHVGIGRPRLIFVKYPWEGKEVLCRGVVMPYHEVRDTKSLTDDEWIERQIGDSREGLPEWLQRLMPTNGIVLQEGK